MPRANRHYKPGHAWHITHRCHKKEFLLKFAKDRQNWIDWLFEARKRYGMVVLNYMEIPITYISSFMTEMVEMSSPRAFNWLLGGLLRNTITGNVERAAY